MSFDEADRFGFDAGMLERRADDFDLAFDARRGEADLASAVVIDGEATQDGHDRIAVSERVLKPPQRDEGGSVAKGCPRTGSIEGATVAVRRQHAALLRANNPT